MNTSQGWIARYKEHHVLRYLIVGTINTGFSYSIYALGLFVGLKYQIANLIALMVGIVFSFKTQGRYVFNNSSNRLFGRYVISWVVIYFVTIILIGKIIDLGLNAYWAGIVALPFSVGLSYLVQKYFVFQRPI